MRIGFLFTLMAFFASIAVAQTAPAPTLPATPSADQMIEQLRSPRTRSLRNLQVESAQPTAATNNATSPASPSNAAAPTSVVSAPAPASISLLIQFDFDSARVREESMQSLANLATALKSEDLKTARFAIEGHTDGKGKADYNQRLSQLRADAVSSYLAAQGVAPQRLQAAGKAASELANKADPSAAENRRVRIVNLE